MNDFLQKLRASQSEKQRPVKKRKDTNYNYNNSTRFNYHGAQPNNRTQGNPRNTPQNGNVQAPKTEEPAMTLLAEAVDNLTTLVDGLAKNQEYLAGVQEKTNMMLDRQASAMEEIVGYLHFAVGSTPEENDTVDENPVDEPVQPAAYSPAPEPRQQETGKRGAVIRKKQQNRSFDPETESTEDVGLLPRERIMEIIHTMRAEGSTYDEVAQYLVKLGQPTFSGRGKWYAQTIHRLYNKK